MFTILARDKISQNHVTQRGSLKIIVTARKCILLVALN